jgi:serine/threonine protein phosphatase PrpC
LWKILIAAKSRTMDLITLASDGLDNNSTADEYARQLIQMASSEESLPSQIAKRAIKTESSLWL